MHQIAFMNDPNTTERETKMFHCKRKTYFLVFLLLRPICLRIFWSNSLFQQHFVQPINETTTHFFAINFSHSLSFINFSFGYSLLCGFCKDFLLFVFFFFFVLKNQKMRNKKGNFPPSDRIKNKENVDRLQ